MASKGLPNAKVMADIDDAHANLSKAHSAGRVIGLREATGGVKDRQDIDVLLKTNPDCFNLYVLALEALQDPTTPEGSYDNITSWFQVAGIHGYPQTSWNGVDVNMNVGRRGGFYCTHGKISFPAWHRPYLNLMEQTIYCAMINQVLKFTRPDLREKYFKAAQDFRLPFWDYFRPREATKYFYDFRPPLVVTRESLAVYRPDNPETLVSMHPNPLHHFVFPDPANPKYKKHADALRFTPGGVDPTQTRRVPQFKTEAKMTEELNKAINNQQNWELGRVLYILTGDDPYTIARDERPERNFDNYSIFSTTGKQVRQAGAHDYSLEGVHDDYHVAVGYQNGHMIQQAYAAFDPIFWLHHCNIDRYLAIYQASHHKPQLPKDKLFPFYKDNDPRTSPENWTYWSSDECWEPENFGYRYPDTNGNTSTILERFWANYEWAYVPLDQYQPSEQSHKKKCPDGMLPLDIKDAACFKDAGALQTFQAVAMSKAFQAKEQVFEMVSSQKLMAIPLGSDEQLVNHAPQGSNLSRAWEVKFQVQRLALNGSFAIYFFIGDVDENSEYWSVEPDLAGFNGVFTGTTQGCPNCQEQSHEAHLYYDSTDLTPMLTQYVKKGDIPDLSAESVVPFLKENFHWRVAKGTGEVVDPRTVDGLEITIVSQTVTTAADAALPTVSNFQAFPEITVGREP